MKHFINLKDIPAKDLRKIISDAKKRKSSRKKHLVEFTSISLEKLKNLFEFYKRAECCSF